jgi:hypothetical protein
METEGSLPHSKDPATCHYPEPDRSNSCLLFSEIHFNIILPCTPTSFKGYPSLRFLHQNPVYAPLWFPIRATCISHLSLLDLITRIIFGEEYVAYNASRPSWAQISSSVLDSRKPSAYVPPLVWATMFYTHMKQQLKITVLCVCVSRCNESTACRNQRMTGIA